MTGRKRQAIVAAALAEMSGAPIAPHDTGWWAGHGNPSPTERNDILGRAAAMARAAERGSMGWAGGMLHELFEGTGHQYGVGGSQGPLDSDDVKIWVRFSFEKGDDIVMRGTSITVNWYSPWDDVLGYMLEMIDEFAKQYGLSKGVIQWDTLVIG